MSDIELIGSGNTNKNDWILAENGKYQTYTVKKSSSLHRLIHIQQGAWMI